jgi:hypothetical protein
MTLDAQLTLLSIDYLGGQLAATHNPRLTQHWS